MSPSQIKEMLLYCFVVNYIILIIWLGFIFATRGAMFHKWFRVSQEDWDRYNLLGIIFFKSAVMLFFLVPWIALTIISRS